VNRLRSFQWALVGVATLGLTASAAPQGNRVTATISLQRHDFGKAIVGSQVKASFRVQLKGPPNPDPKVWNAVLTGEGIPGCVMKVVSCNYGPLYSGLFSWSRNLISSGSEHKESVQVKITDGVAKCLGTATDTENGRSITGIIDGPGLFAVEFEPDSHFPLVYRITAACPTPAYPAIPEDGVEATKSQPAELGHNDQNSEKQPAKEIAQASVEGTIQYKAPETDPVNGVTGTVAISWSLKRK
jgi:hypothetical protein